MIIMAAELIAGVNTGNCSSNPSVLSMISYNMHGFYQGLSVLQELTDHVCDKPDILLLQEHWLTPANLFKFDDYFTDYFSFGCSAMTKCVQSGVLTGRPFGGVITVVNKRLRKITETVCCHERYNIIRISNYLIINVYMPCAGTADRLLICSDILADIQSWCDSTTLVMLLWRVTLTVTFLVLIKLSTVSLILCVLIL